MNSSNGSARSYRIGIDVGGTNTDAVLVDETGAVVASVKRATTPDPFDGIKAALGAVLEGVDLSMVAKAMLGTTHPANAIIQRRGLDRIGVLRLAAPSSLGVRPGAAWPADILATVISRAEIIRGGFEYDGQEIAPLDEDAVRRFANVCASAPDGDRCHALAISSAFSPASHDHELRAGDLVRAEVGDALAISLSHEVGTLGLLERENATALNASLLSVANRVVDGFRFALEQHGLDVDSYLTQNDGTLMTADEAKRFPIRTVGSGPTNSMRGACALAKLSDALVVDVGGTSADIGILVDGFPRESAAAVEVGGVRTNFRMPDLISIGLGGGTVVRPGDDGSVDVGPDSVGYDVIRMAKVMGGSTLTLSDISVAAGRLTGFGDESLIDSLDPAIVARTIEWVDDRLQRDCERMRASRNELPLLAVGGGAHLVADDLAGVAEVIRPPHHSVANAFGAAIAEASGEVDRVYSYDREGREECLNDARELASEAAIRAGADPHDIRITSVVEVPMTYVPGGGCRVQVKAVGPLAK